MRILMAAQQMGLGGAETHVLDLCRALKAAGHEVAVVSAGGLLTGELERAGIRHITLPLHRKDPISLCRSLNGLRLLFSRESFDYVHAHARIPAALLGFLAARRNDVRLVTTCHSDFRVTPLLRRLTRWGDAVMAVSPDLSAYLEREYGVPRSRIFQTVNGIDTDRFSPAPHPPGRRILCVTRMDRGTDAAAEALLGIFPRLLSSFPDASLTLVGGGSRLSLLRNAADRINRSAGRPAVTCTGGLADVLPELRKADLFVGVSRAALEAMGCGLPVILAGAEGFAGFPADEASLDRESRSNWCCRGSEPLTEERLLACLERVLRDPAALAAAGRRNRAYAVSRVSVRVMADDYLRFYESRPLRTLFRDADALFSGYYGQGNYGDDLTLRSLADGLHRLLPDVRLRALTARPRQAERAYGVSCAGAFRPVALHRALRRCGTLVSGGGTLLQDATSARSLWYYTHVLFYAAAHGAGTVLYGCGVGPLLRDGSRERVRRAARQASLICLRDPESLRLLTSLAGDGKAVLSADPVWPLLPGADGCGTPVLAVALHGSRVDFRGRRSFSAFLRRLVPLLREYCRETGLSPVFVPLQPRADGRLCRRLAEETGGTVDGAEVLSRASLILTNRLHGAMAGAAANVPSLLVSRDPKLASLAAAVGLLPPAAPEEISAELLRSAAVRLPEGTSVARLRAQAESSLAALADAVLAGRRGAP